MGDDVYVFAWIRIGRRRAQCLGSIVDRGVLTIGLKLNLFSVSGRTGFRLILEPSRFPIGSRKATALRHNSKNPKFSKYLLTARFSSSFIRIYDW